MAHLKRKTDMFLETWKADTDRKPLIIKGARQVGKTETVREFAKKHYKSVIEINFALQKQILPCKSSIKTFSMTALKSIPSSKI